jgi:hypothetical protein
MFGYFHLLIGLFSLLLFPAHCCIGDERIATQGTMPQGTKAGNKKNFLQTYNRSGS